MTEPASLGLERNNPLPVGRYWVFRIGARDIVDFDAWLEKWRRAGALGVVSSELDPSTSPQTAFIVFKVTQPNTVIWEGPGLPDRSPDHVTSSQDVISAPAVLEPAERLENVVKTVTRAGETLPLLLFAAGVIYLLTREKT
jgi:hypothetical protein